MKAKMYVLGGIVLMVPLLSGCAQIIGDMLFPNYCQQCKVIDIFGNVLWSEEECGGGQEAMATRCKAKAYDESQWRTGVKCECNMK